MAERPDTEWPDDGRAERRARRELQRRRTRRRRLTAIAALAALAVAVLGASLIGLETGDDPSTKATKTPASRKSVTSARPDGHHTSAARNATPQPDWETHPGPVPIL